MSAKKILVNCLDYNGHKNVKFMMSSDDFRLNGENYQILDANAVYVHKAKTLATTHGTFTVFADWSLKAPC